VQFLRYYARIDLALELAHSTAGEAMWTAYRALNALATEGMLAKAELLLEKIMPKRTWFPLLRQVSAS
jgi:hypothetical protein